MLVVGHPVVAVLAVCLLAGCLPSFDLPASSGDGGPARVDGGSDGGMPPASCLGSQPGTELYSTGFDDLAGWTERGFGSWTVQGGEALQSGAAGVAGFRREVPFSRDSRVVLRARSLDPGGVAEIGITMREADDTFHYCGFRPVSGELVILWMYVPDDVFSYYDVAINTSTGTLTNGEMFVMEMEADRGMFRCCVGGVAGASISGTDTDFASNEVGFITIDAIASFDRFAVYDLP